MSILVLFLIIIGVIISFEFIKHNLLRGSSKILVTIIMIIAISAFLLYYFDADIDTVNFNDVKTTGASILDDFKDSIDDFNLNAGLDSFNTRKVYIHNPS